MKPLNREKADGPTPRTALRMGVMVVLRDALQHQADTGLLDPGPGNSLMKEKFNGLIPEILHLREIAPKAYEEPAYGLDAVGVAPGGNTALLSECVGAAWHLLKLRFDRPPADQLRTAKNDMDRLLQQARDLHDRGEIKDRPMELLMGLSEMVTSDQDLSIDDAYTLGRQRLVGR